MRIVILSRNATLYSTRVLAEAAAHRGHEVRVLDTLQFDIRVSRRSHGRRRMLRSSSTCPLHCSATRSAIPIRRPSTPRPRPRP